MGWEYSSVVEHLCSMCEGLSSILNTYKNATETFIHVYTHLVSVGSVCTVHMWKSEDSC